MYTFKLFYVKMKIFSNKRENFDSINKYANKSKLKSKMPIDDIRLQTYTYLNKIVKQLKEVIWRKPTVTV